VEVSKVQVLKKIATSCKLIMFNGLMKSEVLRGHDGLTLKELFNFGGTLEGIKMEG